MSPLFADKQTPRILLVKTSSLGDVLHNLPVVSDIVRHFPDARIDWLVEESFTALPKLHPAVRDVIPVAVRRWRGKLLNTSTWQEIAAFRSALAAQPYDIAIDTQGLLKSALLMRGAQGLRCGFDRDSAREPLAASLYQRTFSVAKGQHAVERNRQLAAQALGYALEAPADYGIRPPAIARPGWLAQEAYAVLLHATSRADKLWDEPNWIALGRYLHEKNIRCILPWGSDTEQARSLRLAAAIPDAVTPPRLNLNEAAALLGGARAAIGVDTGLAHLAAALGVPTVGIYTATDPALTGLYAGRCAVNLGGIDRAPDVAAVIEALQGMAAC
ncbi:MAG: lipopolysaccharide heptosyltransferase I [Gallionellales bacterium RIFCSPLOWO2_12_FULL_59_22]|nr:MAG: lipopolysaccharide heptosyltransferase I [Gallionellales bacterium RIFCSPLOWO2_02_FULL_59_110]OGT12090.1 MAG: lipopolysaccharide heptosyltransferase I [Gallionellales bacterium RIFCSPLOWO2_12_FULL_59_22]